MDIPPELNPMVTFYIQTIMDTQNEAKNKKNDEHEIVKRAKFSEAKERIMQYMANSKKTNIVVNIGNKPHYIVMTESQKNGIKIDGDFLTAYADRYKQKYPKSVDFVDNFMHGMASTIQNGGIVTNSRLNLTSKMPKSLLLANAINAGNI